MILLKWIFKNNNGLRGIDLSGSGQGQVKGVVKMLMNIRFEYSAAAAAGNILTS